MMKHFGKIWFLTIILFAGNLFASDVNNIELIQSTNATVARINIDGPIKFVHQTEIPKDGRPNRVIIDILSAVHKLDGKEFVNLPVCAVSKIRTSQYSVKPEKVVRLVFDMKNSPIYSVNSDGSAVIVTFTDQNVKQFMKWSSSDVKKSKIESKKTVLASSKVTPKKAVPKSKTVYEQNKEIDTDRLASLDSKNSSIAKSTANTKTKVSSVDKTSSVATKEKSKPVVSAPKIKPPKVQISDTVFGPDFSEHQFALDNQSSKKTVLAKPDVSKSKAVVKKETPSKPVATKKTAPEKKKSSIVASKKAVTNPATVAVKKVNSTQGKAKASVKKSEPKVASKKNDQKALAKKLTSSKSTKLAAKKSEKPKVATASKSTNSSVAKKNKVVKKKPAKKQPVVAKKSTSRFRRTPSKIKGTMVAQFPTRLVVKYRKRISRDPFNPLVTENTSYEGPIQGKIPNVEGLKLVGIIESETGSNRALLEDKLGVSYILKTGDKIKSGYVLRVENDKVYFQIFEYGWSRTIAMAIEEY